LPASLPGQGAKVLAKWVANSIKFCGKVVGLVIVTVVVPEILVLYVLRHFQRTVPDTLIYAVIAGSILYFVGAWLVPALQWAFGRNDDRHSEREVRR
jgi:hypothetical protein